MSIIRLECCESYVDLDYEDTYSIYFNDKDEAFHVDCLARTEDEAHDVTQ
jgi:hypothetical protein